MVDAGSDDERKASESVHPDYWPNLFRTLPGNEHRHNHCFSLRAILKAMRLREGICILVEILS